MRNEGAVGDALGQTDEPSSRRETGREQARDQTQYSYHDMSSSGRLPRPSTPRPLNSTASVGRACTVASCIACRGDLHRQEQEHGTPPGLGLAVYYDALLVSRKTQRREALWELGAKTELEEGHRSQGWRGMESGPPTWKINFPALPPTACGRCASRIASWA